MVALEGGVKSSFFLEDETGLVLLSRDSRVALATLVSCNSMT